MPHTAMKHLISLLIENESGSLSRISGLFSARGYGIESISSGPTPDGRLYRMTLLTYGSNTMIEQIIKQLHKLVDVVKVIDLTDAPYIERELLMLKVRAEGHEREEVKRLTDIFRARIIDVSPNTYTIEITGTPEKLNAFLATLDEKQILETVRSGLCAINRGEKFLRI